MGRHPFIQKVQHKINQLDLAFLLPVNWGALSALSELQLEMLYFVATGLSPKVHVKNLIVEKKRDLPLGISFGVGGVEWKRVEWWPHAETNKDRSLG